MILPPHRRGDLNNTQWQRLEPLLPPQKPTVGRPSNDHRTTINGMLWILLARCTVARFTPTLWGKKGELDPGSDQSLLASQLPSYALPDCTAAHTRHYMPVWKEGKETTTKVFDTFLVLAGGTLSPDAEVQVVWPDVQLNQTQTQVLRQLCRQVTYLGRAESWAELSVIETNRIPCNATPLLSEATPEAKQIKVLAPLTPEGLEGFTAAIATLAKPNRGKAKWKAPTDLLEALELDIASLHGQGWNGIPGTRWVTYELKAAERFSQQQGVSIYGDSKPPTFAKFALVSSVLPNLTEAVSVGERFRQALMKWSQDESGKADPVFSGRKDDGQPALDHQHAWYLPEVNKDGKIDRKIGGV